MLRVALASFLLLGAVACAVPAAAQQQPTPTPQPTIYDTACDNVAHAVSSASRLTGGGTFQRMLQVSDGYVTMLGETFVACLQRR